MPKNLRTERVAFRLSKNELEKINREIEKSSMTRSDFFRQLILGEKVTVITGLDEMMKELSRIGNNLNQLTQLAHQGKLENKEELKDLNGKFSEVLLSINELKK